MKKTFQLLYIVWYAGLRSAFEFINRVKLRIKIVLMVVLVTEIR